MAENPMGVGVEVKRLRLVKREVNPATGKPYEDRPPLEVLEWTPEGGLQVIERRNGNAIDDRGS